MKIERLKKNELQFINSLKPEDWNDLIPVHTFYLNNAFCHPKKVVIDNNLVGIGTAICFGKTGWLAHIIVSEHTRNQGIGSFIVLSLMKLLTQEMKCYSVSLIATDLGFPLYSKHGFRTQTEYVAMKRENAQKDNSNQAISIEKLSKNDINQVFRIDKKVSGENRHKIIQQYIDVGYGYSIDNMLVGAYFPSLGEGLVISENERAGIELLKKHIMKTDRITIPVENTIAQDFLRDNGFNEMRRIKRMVFGELFEWNPKGVYSRIGGYLG